MENDNGNGALSPISQTTQGSRRPAGPNDAPASAATVAAAAPAAPDTWSPAAERAVSLPFLSRFYETHVRPLEQAAGRRLSTGEVVGAVIMPQTQELACRYSDLPGTAEGSLWNPNGGADLWFVSHAFAAPFHLLVDALTAHFAALGATPESVFVWLDVFAINQHDTNAELRGGRTLQRTIDIASSTLVVLDRERQLPFTRLWCLFEMGSTPSDKLLLITHGFSERDLSAAFAGINVESADCFDPSAREFIRTEIALQHGSVATFTRFLRLRFLLQPLRYDLDIAALLRRNADSYDFSPLLEWVAPPPPPPQGADAAAQPSAGARGRLAVICGDSGEGKSTLSAALASGFPEVVHAHHFCKHSDIRRQDAVAVAKTLAWQFARRWPQVAEELLKLDPGEVSALQRADEAVSMLLARPLRALPAGERVCVLVDALDEAEGDNALANTAVRLLVSLAFAVDPTSTGEGPQLSVITTTRPKPERILQALRGRWGEGTRIFSPAELRRPSAGAPAAAAPCATAAASARSDANPDAPTVPRCFRTVREALAARAGSKVYCAVISELAKALRLPFDDADVVDGAEAAVPSALDDAYRLWFQSAWPTDPAAQGSVARLLQVTVAAQEPPTLAFLAALGVKGALELLPGYGTLFVLRDFRLHMLHKSLFEWLTHPGSPYRVNSHTGHRLWAEMLAPLTFGLGRRSGGASVAPSAYGVKHALTHLYRVVAPEVEPDLEAEEVAVVGAKAWKDFIDAILDFDFIEACFAHNRDGALIRLLATVGEGFTDAVLFILRPRTSLATAVLPFYDNPVHELFRDARSVAREVKQWLQGQGRFMRADPSCALQRAFCAPEGSALLRAARAFHRQPRARLLHPPRAWPRERMAVDFSRTPEDLCWSPDGSKLLVAFGDTPAEAAIVSAETGEALGTLQGTHSGKLCCCAWGEVDARGLLGSAEEQRIEVLVTADSKGTIVTWSEVGAPILTMVDVTEGEGQGVAALALSGTKLAAAFAVGGHVAVWEWAAGAGAWQLLFRDSYEERSFMPDRRRSVCFSDDGALLLVGDTLTRRRGRGSSVRIYDAATGAQLAAAEGLVGPAAFLPGTSAAIVGPGYCSVVATDQDQKGRLVAERLVMDPAAATAPPEGEPFIELPAGTVATAIGVGYTRRKDSDGHRCFIALAGNSKIDGTGCGVHVLNYDGRSASGAAREVDGSLLLEGHRVSPSRLVPSPAGPATIFATYLASLAKLGNFEAGGTLKVWNPIRVPQHGTGAAALSLRGIVRTCSFSPDGTLLVAADDMCTWSLRDVRTGDVVGGKSNSHGQHISACRFGPDGSWFVTGGGDGVLRRWAASGSGDSSVAPLTEYSGGHTDGVWSAALSADGSRLLSGGEDSRLVVWDVHTGERLSTIECEDSRRRVAACQFAGAATVVAQLSNGDLSWWDAASGEKTAEVRIEGLDQMVSVCASSVGHSAPPPGGASPTVVGAVVKDDATLRFFASEAGAPTGAVIHLGALEDSSGTVQVFRGVAISPDGSMAVAYGSRRLPNESQTFGAQALVFSVKTEKVLGNLFREPTTASGGMPAPDDVRSAHWLDGGRMLVLACATGEVKIFAAPNFECVGTYMCEEPIMTMEACEAVQKAVVQLQEDSSKRAEEDGAAVEGSGVPGMAASSTAAGEAIVAICCMSGKCSIVRFTYDHDERGAPATATTAAAADL